MHTDAPPPPAGELVLLGGGHAHVEVVRRLMRRPEPDLRVTLVSDTDLAPYSGMLPGCVAGHYSWAETCIDLPRLCDLAGVRFLQDRVVALDADARRIALAERPELGFELLSINVGATPDLSEIEGAREHGVPVKPVSAFLGALEEELERLRRVSNGGAEARVLLVGGGAGGVELALALAERLRREAIRACIGLCTRPGSLLPGFAAGARRRLRRALAEARVELVEADVVAADDEGVRTADGVPRPADTVLWVTPGRAPAWLGRSGLPVAGPGFVAVGPDLACPGHERIFAAGDCAVRPERPVPRSGVYAVRAGPVLAENLRRRWRGRPTRRWEPQGEALALVGLGDDRAVASRGQLHASGRWVWRLKQSIDRRFMARYGPRPMGDTGRRSRPRPWAATDPERLRGMRCSGCGAKVPAGLLEEVLAELHGRARLGHPAPEDAARLRIGAESVLVSTDGFRAFLTDPWLFGRIAAVHALNDVHAMGADPAGVTVLAMIPHAADRIMGEDLRLLLDGVAREARSADVPVAGGHSAEARELAVGLTVTGRGGTVAWQKGGLRPGDRLLLTKPLGSGVLLAAAMRGRLAAAHRETLLRGLLAGHGAALPPLRAAPVRGGTDVSGFGLLGHGLEMARAAGVTLELHAARVPAYPGALELLAGAVRSSLHDANAAALEGVALVGCAPAEPRVQLLADPQTAGGLLVGVPAAAAPATLERLRAAGFVHAAEVGCVEAATDGAPALRIRHLPGPPETPARDVPEAPPGRAAG